MGMSDSEEKQRALALRDKMVEENKGNARLVEQIMMLYQRAYHAGTWDTGDRINTKHGLWKD